MMGLFDLPGLRAARARTSKITQERLHERCRAMRGDLLEMVRMRLRQWSGSVTGPDAWRRIFTASIEPLWGLSDAEAPRWAASAAPSRRQIAIARDLIAAVLRFNTPLGPMSRSGESRPGQSRDRAVQPLLRPRERVRRGLGTNRRPALRAGRPNRPGDPAAISSRSACSRASGSVAGCGPGFFVKRTQNPAREPVS